MSKSMKLPSCYLAVHINKDETFYLNKEVLVPRCGLVVRLLNGAVEDEKAQLIELEGFPGGAKTFELIARLCHKPSLESAQIESYKDCFITASNVAILHSASQFLEMTEAHQTNNLIQKTQDFLANMPFWSLPQCMSLLRSCESAPSYNNNAHIIQRCVGLISSKASYCSNNSSPTCFSPESRHSSSETHSSEPYPYACLYEDLTHLSIPMMEKLIMAMISHHVDNKFLAKCLLHYLQRAKKRASCMEGGDLCHRTEVPPSETLEVVVSLLHKLEWASLSCRSLFSLHRLASNLPVSKTCRKKIEEMIGFQLHMATLDNILISRHNCNGSLYDVNLILRLVKKFLQKQADPKSLLKTESLKRVANLLDKYLAEIAPDPGLTAAKFKAVADSLPDYARDAHDDLYRALDIYLEAHPRIQEQEATELCKMIDFHKLSLEASKHVAQSLRFPARVTLQVLLQEQANLKAAMDHHHHGPTITSPASTVKRLGSGVRYYHGHQLHDIINNHIKPSTIACSSMSKSNLISSSNSSSCNYSIHSHSNYSSRRSLYDQMALDYSEEEHDYHLVLQQNEELRTDLQHMQSRVLELEKACGQMRSKVTKYIKTKHFLC